MRRSSSGGARSARCPLVAAHRQQPRHLDLLVGRGPAHRRTTSPGYRLIGAELMELLLDSRETGFEFEVEMITTAIRAGVIIDWVPIRTIYAGRAQPHPTGAARHELPARRARCQAHRAHPDRRRAAARP